MIETITQNLKIVLLSQKFKIMLLSQNIKIVIHRFINRKNNIVFMRKNEGRYY